MSKSTAGSTAASTTSPAEESSSYSVLYYKRKNNKVHKSKGVSKMDGVLTVLPPPKSLVILKDGNLTIFSKSQSPNDIAKKRDLEIDEVVVLGAYEVEIISRDDTTSEASTAAAAAASNKPVLSRKPVRSATTTTLSKMQTAVRGPLHPKPASRPVMSAQNNNQIPKPTYKYKPPAQPKKVAPNKSTTEFYALSHNAGSSEDGENEDEDGGSFVTQKENSSRSSSLKRPLASTSKGTTTTRRPALKKQTREITPILPSSDKAAFVPYRRRPPPVPAAASAAFSSTGGTSIPSSVSTFFPGAIGRLDVPHAIKNVLNPHQIGGVTFLWNCLTGNGNMAAVSPHAQETTMVYKGAILADEMGLGKTLMTIATICALHRQKRDWVSQ
jgi:DNA repair and recombination RAD54-like protein